MSNKVILVTGASRGFGELIVEQSLARGYSAVATARNPSAIVERYRDHPKVLPVALDVTDEAQAHAAAMAAVDHFGRIDVLVNNAGYGLVGAVEEASAREIEAVYRTNVFGLLTVTRAVLPYMRRRRSGHIINFSSVGGYVSHAGWGIYCSSKFAVEAISEALAQELKPLGIHVTAVAPGRFRTDFLDAKSLCMSPRSIEDYRSTVGAIRELVARANHTQSGDPAKLAQVVLGLLDMPNPPTRLPLGSDAVAAIEAKAAGTLQLLNYWRSLSDSTDFPTA
ncbi:MAG TPA: oxidoreductase [Steroidobacter sp.]|uniref:oxidoreductase n=1 Tax=Steroidobacter sp. TaxID=1978227 RepID=UPI002EDA9652